MNTTTLILAVSGLLTLSVLLRFALQPRVRQVNPRKRYWLFKVLLCVGICSQAAGAVAAVFSTRKGPAGMFVLTGLLIALACALEMQKLRKESA